MDEEAGSIMDTQQLAATMQNASYAKETQWSIVFDMENKTLDFYWQRQFEAPHHFVLL